MNLLNTFWMQNQAWGYRRKQSFFKESTVFQEGQLSECNFHNEFLKKFG